MSGQKSASYSDEGSDQKFDLAYEKISNHEEILSKLLVEYLVSKYERGVRIIGNKSWKKEDRAPTVSFVVQGERALRSRKVVEEIDKTGLVSPLAS